MKSILLGAILLLGNQLASQDTTRSPITISGYADIYYQYDFSKPPNNMRQAFIYSHNRHNEFNLNIGFIKVHYEDKNVRANLALATGTYMDANYSAEPGVLKNVFEGNAGFKLSKKKELWIDAGILPSHIGFESAIGKDCWNLTRSILADNSPYFEAGVKITYVTDNGKWLLSGLALNGWQRITRINSNSLISLGAQLQFKPSDKVLLNYSNFMGTDKPDSVRLIRFFHNLYGIFTVTGKFGITTGVDIGIEEKAPNSNQKNLWYSPVLILKYNLTDKWIIAARSEYYCDENQVIIATGTANGFKTYGFSFNTDYMPFRNAMLRIEVRGLLSKDKIFKRESTLIRKTAFVTSSLTVAF